MQSYCKVCQKIYRKEHYLANRKKYITKAAVRNKMERERYREYKETLSCSVCGENHPATLVFHHRDPSTKDFTISSAVSAKGLAAVMREIKKCDVLCANCHRKLHADIKYSG